eukprot:1725964-Prymnesium_polylepis.2
MPHQAAAFDRLASALPRRLPARRVAHTLCRPARTAGQPRDPPRSGEPHPAQLPASKQEKASSNRAR